MSQATTHRRIRVIDRRRDERGIVIVWMALTLVVLLMFAAFMVDLGAWYQQSQDLQRTTDAAALAGATYLPNSPDAAGGDTPANCGATVSAIETAVPTSAYCAALKTAYKNGYTNAVVTTNPDAANNRQLDVEIDQPNVSGFFSNFFSSKLTFKRYAHAEFSTAVQLGSPQNYFGTGTLAGFTGFNGTGTPNFWATISGYCNAKESGDEYAAGFDGNVANPHNGSYTLGATFPTNCNPTADPRTSGTTTCNTGQNMNCEFDPAGYQYTINVPTGVSGVHVYVFNAAYSPCRTQPSYSAGVLVTPPSPPTSSFMDADSNASTNYQCTGSATNPTKMKVYYSLSGPGGYVSTQSFSTDTGTGSPFWTPLTGGGGGWATLGAGTWYLNVSTIRVACTGGPPCTFGTSPAGSDTGPSFGLHNYGLLVSTNSTTPNANLTTGASYICSGTCPTIYANTSTAEAATIVGSGASTATAYLADIPTAAVGKTVTIKIWDPGDYANYLQLIKPDGTVLGSVAGDPTVNYAVSGADPDAASSYGGTVPAPNNTAAASGSLAGCKDISGTTFASAAGAPCFPVDGCVPLGAAESGATTPLVNCTTILPNLGNSSTGATPATDWGAPNSRYGMSRYSDAMVELSFVAQTAGWYGIAESTSLSQVHDTITVNLLINGLPPHLTP